MATSQRATHHLPSRLLDRLNNAAYWTGAKPSRLLAAALTRYLDDLELLRGTPFPPRNGPLRGRPPRNHPSPAVPAAGCAEE
jgi:hypothetical protein